MGIPRKDSEFDSWFLNLKNYVAAKTGGAAPEWTHIPAAAVAELAARREAWHEAFTALAGPHTGVDTERKRHERTAAEAFVRPFIAQYLKFDPVTNADRAAMGVPNRHSPHSRHPVPSSQPDTDARNTVNHFEHEIRAMNAEGQPRKPADAYGVVFAWQVGGERPATGADLPRSEFSRRPVKVVTHTEADKGKTAYYATAYENRRGDRGPWSPVTEAVIA